MYSTPDFLTISLVCCHWLPSAIYTVLAFWIKGRQSILKIKNQYWRRLDLIFICLLKIARIQFSRYISITKTHCVVEFECEFHLKLLHNMIHMVLSCPSRYRNPCRETPRIHFRKNVIIQIQLKIYFSCEVTHRWL